MFLGLLSIATGVNAAPSKIGSDPDPVECTGMTEDEFKGYVDCTKDLASCTVVPTNGSCVGEEITEAESAGSLPYIPCKKGTSASNWVANYAKCRKKVICLPMTDKSGLTICAPIGTTSYSFVPRCQSKGDCVEIPPES